MKKVDYFNKVKAKAKRLILHEYFSVKAICNTKAEKKLVDSMYVRIIGAVNNALDVYEIIEVLQNMKIKAKDIYKILITSVLE